MHTKILNTNHGYTTILVFVDSPQELQTRKNIIFQLQEKSFYLYNHLKQCNIGPRCNAAHKIKGQDYCWSTNDKDKQHKTSKVLKQLSLTSTEVVCKNVCTLFENYGGNY